MQSSRKNINRIPEQGSIANLEEMQKMYSMTNNNTSSSNSNNSNGMTYETPSTNLLSNFYSKEEGNKFMKKINKLNISFLILSDKYLKHQNEIEKVKDNLFINLFKQISIYVEEIERLNVKIREREGSSKVYKENNIKDLNKEINQNKITIKNLEQKLGEKTQNEDKLKKELASYKRQLTFYKDKLKLELKTQKESKKKTYQNPNTSTYINVNTSYSNTVLKTTANKKIISNSLFTSPYNKPKEGNKSVKKVTICNTSNSPMPYRKLHKKNLSLNDDFTLTSRSETTEKSKGKTEVSHKAASSVHTTGKSGNCSTSCIFGNLDISQCSGGLINSNSENIKKGNSSLFEKKGCVSFLERQAIMEQIGADVQTDCDKEIKMLIEQENEIVKLMKMMGK